MHERSFNPARLLRPLLAILLIFSACANPQPAGANQAPLIQRISSGSQGFGGGSYAAISGNGQFVVFESPANDLSNQHISGSWDAYASDLHTSNIEMVSLNNGGEVTENPGNYTSPPAVSQDGRYVAFVSEASDLVSGDTNGAPDIFLRDRTSGATQLVSLNLTGGAANGPSFTPAISSNGRFVVFQSFASNLVSGDTNGAVDIFLRDRQINTTEIISVTDRGVQGSDPNEYGFSSVAVSADGRHVAFSYQDLPVSGAPGSLPAVYLRDRQSQTTRYIATGDLPVISANGRFVAFVTLTDLVPEDKNFTNDIYLFDQVDKHFELVSLSVGAPLQDPAWILTAPDISADGRFIVFETTAPLVNLDGNDFADIYLLDRQLNQTRLLSATSSGSAGNGESHYPAVDDDGTITAFTSFASNLVPGDNNDLNDVFVRTLDAPQPITIIASVYMPILFGH